MAGAARIAGMLIHYPDGDVGVYRMVADDPTAYPSKRECLFVGTHEQCADMLARDIGEGNDRRRSPR